MTSFFQMSPLLLPPRSLTLFWVKLKIFFFFFFNGCVTWTFQSSSTGPTFLKPLTPLSLLMSPVPGAWTYTVTVLRRNTVAILYDFVPE